MIFKMTEREFLRKKNLHLGVNSPFSLYKHYIPVSKHVHTYLYYTMSCCVMSNDYLANHEDIVLFVLHVKV